MSGGELLRYSTVQWNILEKLINVSPGCSMRIGVNCVVKCTLKLTDAGKVNIKQRLMFIAVYWLPTPHALPQPWETKHWYCITVESLDERGRTRP